MSVLQIKFGESFVGAMNLDESRIKMDLGGLNKSIKICTFILHINGVW